MLPPNDGERAQHGAIILADLEPADGQPQELPLEPSAQSKRLSRGWGYPLEWLQVQTVGYHSQKFPRDDSVGNEAFCGGLADDRHLVHQTISQPVRNHPDGAALVNIVDGGD